MKIGSKWLQRACLALMLLLLAACVGRTPDVTYYSLTPVESLAVNPHQLITTDVAIGVGPVTIPDYLKRVQIATRVDHNRYEFNEYVRWAGLLEENIVTVTANNLGLLLGTDKIATYPWLDHFKPDYRVTIKILQLDGQLHGNAVLVARWAVSDRKGKLMLASGKSELSRPVEDASYAALVDAESLLLADFCKELANQVQRLHAKR